MDTLAAFVLLYLAHLVLVGLTEVLLPQRVVPFHLNYVALRDLHLFRRRGSPGVLAVFALLSGAVVLLLLLDNCLGLFVAGIYHVDLLADLDWALADSEAEVAVARRALPIREDILLVLRALVE